MGLAEPVSAVLFPGQGAQLVGMGQDAAKAFPEARRVFAEADEALGFAISRLCFEGPAEELRRTEITQPAILTASWALYAVLAAGGFRPVLAAGLSLGEYTAAVAAGVLSFADAVRLVHRRGRYMQEAVPEGEGAMAAVLGLDDETVDAVCAEIEAEARQPHEVVQAANYNCPGQVVLSGSRAAVGRAAALAKARGAKRTLELPVSAPFHCPLMHPAAQRLALDFEALAWREPVMPVVANVDGRAHDTAADIRAALAQQVEAPVRWSSGLRTMAAAGVERFVEVGPGAALSGFVRRTLPGAATVSVQAAADLKQVIAVEFGGLLH